MLAFTSKENSSNFLVVSLKGLLRHAQDLTDFYALVRRAIERSGVHVVLDMAEVSFVNSFGLGFLMLLRGVHTKINSIIPVFNSTDEAKAHVLSLDATA